MNTKLRESKESKYTESNSDVRSVCNGQFYKKGGKSYEQCKNCANCYKYKSYKSKSQGTPEVHFHYVDTFRKCEFYKIRPITEEDIVKVCVYNIIYVNDLACACVVALSDKIKEQDKETRRIFSALEKRRFAYERMINDIMSDNIDILSRYGDYMDEKVQPMMDNFIEEMRNTISNVTDSNVDFIALEEVARTMIGYSVMNVENRVKECLKFNKDSVNLRMYKLTEMLSAVESLSKWVVRHCNGIDINKEKDVIQIYRKIDKALTNFEIINGCINKAK